MGNKYKTRLLSILIILISGLLGYFMSIQYYGPSLPITVANQTSHGKADVGGYFEFVNSDSKVVRSTDFPDHFPAQWDPKLGIHVT